MTTNVAVIFTHGNINISVTIYLVFNSNISVKSLDFSPSASGQHVKIIFILMIGKFENLFFYFYFLNISH